MEDFRKNLRVVEPYVPGEQPKQSDMIKLNTNENPYPPAPMVEKVLKEISIEDLRLYPKPDAKELVDALAKEYNVAPEQIFVGVGSDDVLGMAFLTCFSSLAQEEEVVWRTNSVVSATASNVCQELYLTLETQR